MIPGLNPKQMKMAMKRMGMKQEEIEAEEVIIKQKDKQLRVLNPQVIKINMMGQETLQIMGDIKEESLEKYSEDDVKTVIEQTGCSEKEAKKVLEETNDLAEAILKLKRE